MIFDHSRLAESFLSIIDATMIIQKWNAFEIEKEVYEAPIQSSTTGNQGYQGYAKYVNIFVKYELLGLMCLPPKYLLIQITYISESTSMVPTQSSM